MSSINDNVVIFFTGVRSDFSFYLVLLCYFWAIWFLKFLLAYCVYKPFHGWAGNKGVSIIVPTYKETNETLSDSVERILHESNTMVREVLIVTDEREAKVAKWCRENWAHESRVRVLVSPVGKRQAVRLGIESALHPILVIIESDTFAEPGSIDELIKPIAQDERIGGVVGDQLIYEPTANSINFFNNLIEVIKYRFTIPALSVFGCVTVLGGRCVAFRKSAILPLMDALQKEEFLGMPCISGDDGRVTSLLLCTGWRCVYQRTAVFLTISPPSLKIFMKQRMRWARNSCRRTIRAIFCIKEKHVDVPYTRFWAYKRPAILFQVLTVWLNTLVMTAVVGLTIYSLITGEWFWVGTSGLEVTLRIFVFLFLGMAVRRLVRVFPAFRTTPCKYVPWLFLMPWYLLLMWVVRIYSIFTMNRQGWVTRTSTGAGGFGKAGDAGDSSNDKEIEIVSGENIDIESGIVHVESMSDSSLVVGGEDDRYIVNNPMMYAQESKDDLEDLEVYSVYSTTNPMNPVEDESLPGLDSLSLSEDDYMFEEESSEGGYELCNPMFSNGNNKSSDDLYMEAIDFDCVGDEEMVDMEPTRMVSAN